MTLNLSRNELSGALPSTLGDLSELQELRLSFNQLGGGIPEDLGDLSNLETLSLARSQLTGSIPAALGNLANLEVLFLQGNELDGTIPATLTNLGNLEKLSLKNNSFTGCIPAGLQDVATNDLDQLGLDFCGSPADGAPADTPTSSDRDALVALYNATNGANWTNNDNWLFNEPIGNWYGVDTDGNGRVIRLDIHSNQLPARYRKSWMTWPNWNCCSSTTTN